MKLKKGDKLYRLLHDHYDIVTVVKVTKDIAHLDDGAEIPIVIDGKYIWEDESRMNSALYIYNTDPTFHNRFIRRSMENTIRRHINNLKYLRDGEVESLYNEVKKVFNDKSEL